MFMLKMFPVLNVPDDGERLKVEAELIKGRNAKNDAARNRCCILILRGIIIF